MRSTRRCGSRASSPATASLRSRPLRKISEGRPGSRVSPSPRTRGVSASSGCSSRVRGRSSATSSSERNASSAAARPSGARGRRHGACAADALTPPSRATARGRRARAGPLDTSADADADEEAGGSGGRIQRRGAGARGMRARRSRMRRKAEHTRWLGRGADRRAMCRCWARRRSGVKKRVGLGLALAAWSSMRVSSSA